MMYIPGNSQKHDVYSYKNCLLLLVIHCDTDDDW